MAEAKATTKAKSTTKTKTTIAAKEEDSKKGNLIAIAVSGVIVVIGIVIAILFATGVLGGPKVVGTYTLTGMKQGDQDMMSLITMLTKNGQEATLEMREDGTCKMSLFEESNSEGETNADEGITCKYDAKKNTMTNGEDTIEYKLDGDNITFESEGISMTFTRNK